MEELVMDKNASDHGGGMEMADGAKPSDAEDGTTESEETPVKKLAQRIAAVREGCDHIKKESAGVGTGHSVEEVLRQVRPLLAKHALLVTQNLLDVSYDGNRCNVRVSFTWECTDTEESREIIWGGSDTDKAGKALAKAMTNAMKEHFKKFLLITDREDAKEETDQIEHRKQEGATREEVEDAHNQAREAIKNWASTFKSALENAKSKKEVERIARESKDQLISPDLPDVTRTFFEELIEKQKKELP